MTTVKMLQIDLCWLSCSFGIQPNGAGYMYYIVFFHNLQLNNKHVHVFAVILKLSVISALIRLYYIDTGY